MKTLRYFLVLFLFEGVLTTAAQEKSGGILQVQGEVVHPRSYSLDDLKKLGADTASFRDRAGEKHLFRGVPILHILRQAGVSLGRELRGENLSKYLLVQAGDGYQVLFSLAELDSNFRDRNILLAYEMDGKTLPKDKGQLRLIVPDEKVPARSCYDVVSFYIGWAKE